MCVRGGTHPKPKFQKGDIPNAMGPIGDRTLPLDQFWIQDGVESLIAIGHDGLTKISGLCDGCIRAGAAGANYNSSDVLYARTNRSARQRPGNGLD